jgi:hypothetical protein
MQSGQIRHGSAKNRVFPPLSVNRRELAGVKPLLRLETPY